MRRKLFLYMLVLALLLLSALAVGLFLLENYATVKEKTSNNLSFQMNVFKRQIERQGEELTMMGLSLSDDLSLLIDGYLDENSIVFSDLNDSQENIRGVQSVMFQTLHDELFKTDCSGAFVILDATVNTTPEQAEVSRTGLYFQRSSLDDSDESLLLLRGMVDLGKENGVMPHRKWRLQFRTDLIPGYADGVNEFKQNGSLKYFMSDAFTLDGTSERVIQFMAPLFGAHGDFYGVCGFEISGSYFENRFAQPSRIEHLTCMITQSGESLDPSAGFTAGVLNGYYLPPEDPLSVKDFGKNLVQLSGDSSFVGMISEYSPYPEKTFSLCVMIPQEDYNRMVVDNVLNVVFLLALLITATVFVCIFFSRRFLAPLLKGLEQIRKQEHGSASSPLAEIDDLFEFLARQDRLYDEIMEALKREYDDQAAALVSTKAEVDRLSYSRKKEVDPDDYEFFKNGMHTLTKTEKKIFGMYLSGMSADEIIQTLKIQESTLKYHNHNILGKLGVSSRKQMLRYATLLKQEEGWQE